MRYYRLQPAGLGIDHRSEASDGERADGLHVLTSPTQLDCLDCPFEAYGDEVVVIEADRHWSHGDVEGVCIDGAVATIVARVPLAEFRIEDWDPEALAVYGRPRNLPAYED